MKPFNYKITLLILIILSIGIFIPRSPFILKIPGGDSGVFLYSGWRLLQGEILYKDIWDHKPPLIHFINALGLALSNNTMWGVWFIQVTFLIAAALCCFFLLLRYFGYWPALITTIISLINFAYLVNEGNFPQGYILTFQYISLILFLKTHQEEIRIRDIVIIGMCGAFTLLLQPNAIGIWIVIFLFLLYNHQNKKRHQLRLIGFFIGGFVPILVILLYFYTHNALSDMFDQVITYNFYYSVVPLANRFLAIYMGFIFYLLSSMSILAAYGYSRIFSHIVKKTKESYKYKIIFLYVLVATPIELIFSSLSGRQSSNYYITWLPVFTILSCYSIYQLSRMLHTKIFNIAMSGLVIINIIGIIYISRIQINQQIVYNSSYVPLIAFISKNTNPDDTLLIWGHDVRFLFLAKRKSPTRFVYQYPLFTKGYSKDTFVNEFYRDIAKRKPKYLIETRTAVLFIESYSKHGKYEWNSFWPTYSSSLSMQRVYNYIDNHYILETSEKNWKIYKVKKDLSNSKMKTL